MNELLRPFAEHKRTAWTLALVLFGTFAYFVPAPAWNQNSRFALTRALVERQSTIIDADHETTGDKSYRDGHFYCDKAPGTSVLAAIPYAIVYGASRVLGADPPEVSVIPLDLAQHYDAWLVRLNVGDARAESRYELITRRSRALAPGTLAFVQAVQAIARGRRRAERKSIRPLR